MKPILLGMNNPISSNPEHALYPSPPGCTGHRLFSWSGLTEREYLDDFERRNVLDGKQWSVGEARKVQAALRDEFRGRTVVLLGQPVNSIIRGGEPDELARPFVWTPDGHGGWRALVPHPSGLNRFYNDPLGPLLVGVFMQELHAWARTHDDPPVARRAAAEQADLFC